MGKEVKSGKCTISKENGERRASATVAPETTHGFSVSLKDTVRCWTGFADIVSNVVRCWKKQGSLGWSATESAVSSRPLNSCPGKGIIDAGCAEMMMGPDTFQRSLNLLRSEERAYTEKVRAKDRFRFGNVETRISLWSAGTPMNVGGQVCRERVATVASDAPFSIPLLQRKRAVLDMEQGQVAFNKLGVTLKWEESVTGHNLSDLISGCAGSTTQSTENG